MMITVRCQNDIAGRFSVGLPCGHVRQIEKNICNEFKKKVLWIAAFVIIIYKVKSRASQRPPFYFFLISFSLIFTEFSLSGGQNF